MVHDAQPGRAGSAVAAGPRRVTTLCWVRAAVRRHWLLLAVLTVGAVLRVAVMVGYWPALELYGDSYAYLEDAQGMRPSAWHPFGYSLLLKLLSFTGHLAVVPAIQHAAALGVAVGLYALLLRLGVRRGLAVIGVAPVLFDGYQLDVEQFVLSETLLEALLVAAFFLLLARRELGATRAAAAGFLLAAATLTRTAALPIVVLAAGYLLLRWQWRPIAAFAAAVVIPILGYAGWYSTVHGTFAMQQYGGQFLYGRVAALASCDYPLPAAERRLCDPRPPAQRPGPEFYVWDGRSPLHQPGLGSESRQNTLGEGFALAVIEHQPLDYLASAAAETWHYFTLGHSTSPRDFPLARQQFPDHPPASLHVRVANVGFNGTPVAGHTQEPVVAALRGYQSVLYTPGPLLLAALLGAGAVGAGLLSRCLYRHERAAALLLGLSGLVLVAVPSLTTGFSYRYELPLLVTLPAAGVLAAEILAKAATPATGRSGLARPDRTGTAQHPDPAPPHPPPRPAPRRREEPAGAQIPGIEDRPGPPAGSGTATMVRAGVAGEPDPDVPPGPESFVQRTSAPRRGGASLTCADRWSFAHRAREARSTLHPRFSGASASRRRVSWSAMMVSPSAPPIGSSTMAGSW